MIEEMRSREEIEYS